jgi:hypothetical protein
MPWRSSTEPERDEGGWKDWPPSAEIALQTLPINVIVGRHGVPHGRETTRRTRGAASSRETTRRTRGAASSRE